MALTTDNDTNEESQTRQLRVNKKLSKVISSVPRSRFQKPRPNLPGSKRTEPNVPAAPAKTSEKSKKDLPEKDEVSTTIEKSEKIIDEKDEIPTPNGKSEKNNSELEKKLEKISSVKIGNLTLIEDDNNSITLNTESIQNLEELPEVNCPVKDKNQPIINSPDKNKNQPVINSPDKIKNQNLPIINSSDKNKNQNLPINYSSDKNKNQPVTNLVSSAVITNTDKSSKYPHLTSILSKKRAEPRKEVQHKRHKKFKKGDVIPERSKMTMADLIYWNPVNTDPPSKDTPPEEETQANSNYEEPEECVDNPDEENSAGDTSAGLSVPKLVIAEDGSINIDQSSLVISRNIPEPTVTEVVRKDDTTYSSFRKRPMTKQWTAKDTTIFYKALSLVGTDFGLMEQIIPHRTRRELKLKFKREEKFNLDLINRAMYESHLTFDGTTLEDMIEQLNDLIFECDPDHKSKENKQKDKRTKESKSASIAQKKSTNRKRKIATDAVEDIADATTESLLCEVTKVGTEVKKEKVRRKRKTKKLDDDFVESDEGHVSPNIVLPTAVGESKAKRKRKSKKLPEDFIDSDEMSQLIENEMIEQAICDDEQDLSEDETEAISQSESTLNSKVKDNYETTNIEILCVENVGESDLSACLGRNKALIVPENAMDVAQLILEEDGTISQKISIVNENDEEQCITVEYVDDVNQNTDTTLVSNVMAYEVVSSSTVPISRRRKMNFTPKVPVKDKISDPPPKISSTSYTPV